MGQRNVFWDSRCKVKEAKLIPLTKKYVNTRENVIGGCAVQRETLHRSSQNYDSWNLNWNVYIFYLILTLK